VKNTPPSGPCQRHSDWVDSKEGRANGPDRASSPMTIHRECVLSHCTHLTERTLPPLRGTHPIPSFTKHCQSLRLWDTIYPL